MCAIPDIMQEGENPFGGVESFDTVYYATLQIIVLASVNTVSFLLSSHRRYLTLDTCAIASVVTGYVSDHGVRVHRFFYFLYFRRFGVEFLVVQLIDRRDHKFLLCNSFRY